MFTLNWFFDPSGRKLFRASVTKGVEFVRANGYTFQRINNSTLGLEDRFVAISILTLPESSIVEHA